MSEMWESGTSSKKLYGTKSQMSRNNSGGRRRQNQTTGFCRRLVDKGSISKSKEKTTQIVFNYSAIIQKVSCKQLPGNKKAIFLRKRGNQLSIKCQDSLPTRCQSHNRGEVMCITETTEGSNRGLSKYHSRIVEVRDEDLEE